MRSRPFDRPNPHRDAGRLHHRRDVRKRVRENQKEERDGDQCAAPAAKGAGPQRLPALDTRSRV
jgi:hypothetical protein